MGLKFPLGVKKIKFTSSSTNGHHPETFANVSFFATAVKEPTPNDIIAVENLDQDDKTDGTQYTENILNPEVSVVDPLAQTFRVEKLLKVVSLHLQSRCTSPIKMQRCLSLSN